MQAEHHCNRERNKNKKSISSTTTKRGEREGFTELKSEK
jgi:hypothetical protein